LCLRGGHVGSLNYGSIEYLILPKRAAAGDMVAQPLRWQVDKADNSFYRLHRYVPLYCLPR
jgi:hypothetical protein